MQDVAELLRENRGLQRVTVNLAPDTWCSGNTPELKCSGTYETIVGSSETPTSLTIRECRNGFFGRVSRRYICNL